MKHPQPATPAPPIPELWAELDERYGWRVIARHGHGLTEEEARAVIALVNTPSREVEELRAQLAEERAVSDRQASYAAEQRTLVLELRELVREAIPFLEEYGCIMEDTEDDERAGAIGILLTKARALASPEAAGEGRK